MSSIELSFIPKSVLYNDLIDEDSYSRNANVLVISYLLAVVGILWGGNRFKEFNLIHWYLLDKTASGLL